MLTLLLFLSLSVAPLALVPDAILDPIRGTREVGIVVLIEKGKNNRSTQKSAFRCHGAQATGYHFGSWLYRCSYPSSGENGGSASS